MNSGPNIFQIVLFGLFCFFIVGAVAYLALFRGQNPLQSAGNVTIWGTLPSNLINQALQDVKQKTDGIANVTYIEKDPQTYDSELLEALSSGRGPDLMMITQDQLIMNLDRITIVPYTSLSERTFKDTFLEQGDLLLLDEGVAGIPFYFDPLVMYWNRDLFGNASIATPPKYWDEFLTLVPKLTKRDNNQNILESGLAFGEFRNVTHAKEILTLLMLQAGTPIVTRSGDLFTPNLNLNIDGGNIAPGTSAVRFYTEFANPIKTVYSWNRELPESRQMFLSGDLAIYFGFASEYPDIKAANPNLNFDLAVVPQSRTAKRRTAYGELTAFAIPKLAKNSRGAFIAATILVREPSLQVFSDATKMPPVRRGMLAVPQTDAYRSVLYDSAIISRAWYDPDPEASREIFGVMIDQITSGRKEASVAVDEAESELKNLFR